MLQNLLKSNMMTIILVGLALIVGFFIVKEIQNLRRQLRTQKSQIKRLKTEIMHGMIQPDMTSIGYNYQIEAPPVRTDYSETESQIDNQEVYQMNDEETPEIAEVPVEEETEAPVELVDNNPAPEDCYTQEQTNISELDPQPEEDYFVQDSSHLPKPDELEQIMSEHNQEDSESDEEDEVRISFAQDSSHLPLPNKLEATASELEEMSNLSADSRPKIRLQFKKR